MFVNEVNFVLASRDPKGLAEFYSLALDAKRKSGANNDIWFVVKDKGMKLQIYRPSQSKSYPTIGKNFALCIQGCSSEEPLGSIREMSLDLISIGATVAEEAKLELFGAELWMRDPEGNNFLLYVPISEEETN